jgi:hypothetical protein
MLGGCSLVNDPGRHQGGDAGAGGVDGGSADGGLVDGGHAPISAESACAVLAASVCEAYENCCSTPVRDRATCERESLANCRERLDVFLTDIRTGYSAELAAQVIAQGRALQETCDPAIAQWFTYDLLTVLEGTLPRTATCVTLADIVDGDYAGVFSCQRNMETVCRPVGGVLGNWECQGASNEGGPCNMILHCARGLYCTGNFLATGMCARQKSNGTACVSNEECSSLHCNAEVCTALDEDIYCAELFPDPSREMTMP